MVFYHAPVTAINFTALLQTSYGLIIHAFLDNYYKMYCQHSFEVEFKINPFVSRRV